MKPVHVVQSATHSSWQVAIPFTVRAGQWNFVPKARQEASAGSRHALLAASALVPSASKPVHVEQLVRHVSPTTAADAAGHKSLVLSAKQEARVSIVQTLVPALLNPTQDVHAAMHVPAVAVVALLDEVAGQCNSAVPRAQLVGLGTRHVLLALSAFVGWASNAGHASQLAMHVTVAEQKKGVAVFKKQLAASSRRQV